ncbi:MAG: hypothetical protein OQL18_02430, partial [Deltaproteobacteria bacterium]|nr:hypothetical protein [Deltaproteobacteria bacterium]
MRPPAFVIIVLFIFVSSIFISLKYGNVLALLTISSDNLQVKRPATQQLKLGEIASVDLYGSGFDRNFSLNL